MGTKRVTLPLTFKTASIVLDFKDLDITSINDIPIGNKASYDELVGDAEVFEFVNRVLLGEEHPAHPDPWTTVILSNDWAESYASGINKVPAPLYINGHSDAGVHPKMRAIPDGYVVGAKVFNKNTLYIRNLLAISGTVEKQELVKQTIKEIKAKMLSTSSSDLMRVDYSFDEEQMKSIYTAVESLKARSNALVEADQTGSDADIVVTSFKGVEVGVADNNNIQGESEMEGKITDAGSAELCVVLKNRVDTGKLPVADLAKNLGIPVLTEADGLALSRLKSAEERLGMNIDEYLKKVDAEKQSTFNQLKKSAIDARFKSPELIETAESLFSLKEGTADEVNAEIERIAALGIFKAILGAKAGELGAAFATGSTAADGGDDNTMEG